MQEFVDFSKELAAASGEIIMRYFRSDFTVESKDDDSPVTIADRKAEEIMREMIMKEFPAHGIIGEEFGVHNESAEYQWVLDPIDGTKSFVSGTFLFGTLIGLMKDGQPIVGSIHHPLTSHLLIGAGDEARLNDELVRVRETAHLRDAVMVYSDFIDVGRYQNGIAFQQLMGKTRFNRTWGDCHGYFLLATGYADIMLDPIMHLWDIVALVPVIKGAGGVITSWNGGPPLIGQRHHRQQQGAAPPGVADADRLSIQPPTEFTTEYTEGAPCHIKRQTETASSPHPASGCCRSCRPFADPPDRPRLGRFLPASRVPPVG